MQAVIYARFSPRPEEDAARNTSIETQVERCLAYAKARGWTVEPSSIMRDQSVSGAIFARHGLQDAITRTRRHGANGVLLVSDLSRLSRKALHFLTIADMLAESKAHLAVLDPQIDTTGPYGRCVLTILAAVSELQRSETSLKTSMSHKRKFCKGESAGSTHPPYGYAFGRKRLIGTSSTGIPYYTTTLKEHPHEIQVVRDIMMMVEQGLDKTHIAMHMNRDKKKYPPRGKAWRGRTVGRIIGRAVRLAQYQASKAG